MENCTTSQRYFLGMLFVLVVFVFFLQSHLSGFFSNYFKMDTISKSRLPPINMNVGHNDKIKLLKYVQNKSYHKYLLGGQEICAGSIMLDYIIYVHSAPDHFVKRQLIRSTWGKPNLLKGYKSRTIFVLGTRRNKALQENITRESQKNKDIVQADFIDHYHNLTRKGLAAMEWVIRYCSHVKYLVKSDDDVLLDVFKLIPKQAKAMGNRNSKASFCRMETNNPCTTRKNWCVIRKSQLVDLPYCAGAMYMYTFNLLLHLFNQSFYKPIVDYMEEDVYITGILPHGLNVNRTNLKLEMFSKSRPPPKNWVASVSVPRYDWYKGVQKPWREMLQERKTEILNFITIKHYNFLLNLSKKNPEIYLKANNNYEP